MVMVSAKAFRWVSRLGWLAQLIGGLGGARRRDGGVYTDMHRRGTHHTHVPHWPKREREMKEAKASKNENRALVWFVGLFGFPFFLFPIT